MYCVIRTVSKVARMRDARRSQGFFHSLHYPPATVSCDARSADLFCPPPTSPGFSGGRGRTRVWPLLCVTYIHHRRRRRQKRRRWLRVCLPRRPTPHRTPHRAQPKRGCPRSWTRHEFVLQPQTALVIIFYSLSYGIRTVLRPRVCNINTSLFSTLRAPMYEYIIYYIHNIRVL